MTTTPDLPETPQEDLAALLPARHPGDDLNSHLARLSGFREALWLLAHHPDVDVDELRAAALEQSVTAIRDEVLDLRTLTARGARSASTPAVPTPVRPSSPLRGL